MVNGHIILPHILQDSFSANSEVCVKYFSEIEIILVNKLIYHLFNPCCEIFSNLVPIIVHYVPETDSLTAEDETCMMLMLIMMFMLIMMLMLMLIVTLKSMSINVDVEVEINFDVDVAVEGDVDAVFDDFVDGCS